MLRHFLQCWMPSQKHCLRQECTGTSWLVSPIFSPDLPHRPPRVSLSSSWSLFQWQWAETCLLWIPVLFWNSCLFFCFAPSLESSPEPVAAVGQVWMPNPTAHPHGAFWLGLCHQTLYCQDIRVEQGQYRFQVRNCYKLLTWKSICELQKLLTASSTSTSCHVGTRCLCVLSAVKTWQMAFSCSISLSIMCRLQPHLVGVWALALSATGKSSNHLFANSYGCLSLDPACSSLSLFFFLYNVMDYLILVTFNSIFVKYSFTYQVFLYFSTLS